jgi:hypothetical protein
MLYSMASRLVPAIRLLIKPLCPVKDCANRIKHAQHNGHNYFFSWEYELTKDLKVGKIGFSSQRKSDLFEQILTNFPG